MTTIGGFSLPDNEPKRAALGTRGTTLHVPTRRVARAKISTRRWRTHTQCSSPTAAVRAATWERRQSGSNYFQVRENARSVTAVTGKQNVMPATAGAGR